MYLFNPLDSRGGKRFFVSRDGLNYSEVDQCDLAKENSGYLTYNSSFLVDAFSGLSSASLPHLIDINLALSLKSGRPVRKEDGLTGGEFFQYLLKKRDPKIRPFAGYCFHGKRDQEERLLLESVKEVGRNLSCVWNEVKGSLEERNEDKRFFDIEIPIAQIFLRRQLLGIRVDFKILQEKLDAIGTAAAIARRKLRLDYSILDPDDPAQVSSAIEKHPLLSSVVGPNESESTLRVVLRMFSARCGLAAALQQYRDAVRSRAILLTFGVSEFGRVNPDFRTMGTVTGRIVASNPSLQNLPKIHRDLLLPDEGMTFCYPDFKQCEPGILAEDCADPLLIRDYNERDLYASLSVALFGSEAQRSTAKLLFLFVCFGMAKDRIAKIGSRSTGTDESAVFQAVTAFFSRYPGIDRWRERLVATIRGEGRVGTPCGNYRYFDEDEAVAFSLRGAQSQRIQGTAALILKEIILDISRSESGVEIVLPMHDALLLAIPNDRLVETIPRIEKRFQDGYRRYCPSIQPRVTFEKFSGNKLNS